VDGRKRFYERNVREREIEGERKVFYNKFIQDPGSDPKLSEKSDPDSGSDPKKIIPDLQHWHRHGSMTSKGQIFEVKK
jgi:hypothetical protein